MSRINIIEESELYGLIKAEIGGCVIKGATSFVTDYNHDARIDSVPLVLKNGLLSKRKRIALLENRALTEKEEYTFSDEYCVNGADNISLSSLNVPFHQMYPNEEWYDSTSGICVNLGISGVNAYKTTTNYFNEFLVENMVDVSCIKSVDVRILKIFDYYKREPEKITEEVLKQYEFLRKIALTIKELNLPIVIREASTWNCTEIKNGKYIDKIIEDRSGIVTLDTDRVIGLPEINVKRKI